MAIVFHQCESHPGRKLTAHLEDVGSRLTGPALQSVGLFHDAGKATEYFQDHLYGHNVGDPALSHHSLLGAELFLRFALPAVAEGLLSIEDLGTGYVFIRRHHGALDNVIDGLSVTVDRATLTRQLTSLDIPGLVEWLRCRSLTFGVDVLPNHAELRVRLMRALRSIVDAQPAMARFQKALLSFGSLIEADRDSAGGFAEDAFHTVCAPLSFDHVQGLRSRLDTSQVAATLAHERERLFDAGASMGAECFDMPAGLWTLTAPTGSGKTLAALAWAFRRRAARSARGHKRCRLIYALPFTSIIDQTVSVLESMYDDDSSLDESVLSVHHHQAEPGVMAMRGEDSVARIWTEGWRADMVCTTFAQIASALFHGTAADSRRFKNLAGGILILDEVQAIPVHLWRPFAEALTSLCKNSATDVLLMTATQPELFPRGTAIEIAPPDHNARVFDRYDLEVNLASQVELEVVANDAERVLATDDEQSCLVVLNTVREALEVYERLASRQTRAVPRLLHLSTNLRPKDRRHILNSIRSRPRDRVLLVSTQVVEAGVDLTFDIVFRALAPLDSIIQASGRCNRHGSGKRGLVHVFEPSGGSAERIYGSVHIDVARSFLGKQPRRFTEPELRGLLAEYYRTLRERTSSRNSELILEAVKMMEFANLRGESVKESDRDKRVLLIEDDVGRVPHYIETDESDAEIWDRFRDALDAKDRRAIRRLRSHVSQRIVEVPARFALSTKADTSTGLVHVPRDAAERVYSSVTGWRR